MINTRFSSVALLTLLAVVGGFALRVVASIYFGSETVFPDSDYYLANARSVLSGEGYDPGYFRGPLYSYFIAAIFALFGESVTAVQTTQAVLWIAIALIWSSITFRLFSSRLLAVVAAALISLHPFLVALSALVISETLYILCYSLALWFIFVYRVNGRGLLLFLSGIWLGVSFLARSNAIAFVPLLLIWLALLPGLRMSRIFTRPLFLLVGFSLVAVPYLLTLHRNLGTWTLDGYGMQFVWAATVLPLYGPIGGVIEDPNDLNEAQRQQVARYTPEAAGESFVERNRLYKEQVLKYVRENPSAYAKKLIGKFFNNFALTLNTITGPAVERWRVTTVGSALVLGSTYSLLFAGLWMRRRNLLELGPLLIVIVASIAIFTVYMSRVRYTLSIVPAMTPLIAFAAEWFVRCLKTIRFRSAAQGRAASP